MQHLRTLIFVGFASLIFSVHQTYAEPADLSVSSQQTQTSGNPSVDFPRSQSRIGSTHSVIFNSPRFENGIRLGINATTTKSDYSNFAISNLDGTETFLNTLFDQPEQSLATQVDFSKSWFAMNISHSRSISKGPFEYHFTKLSQSSSFNHSLSSLQIGLGLGTTQQPLTHYTDLSTAKRLARPTALSASVLSLGVDHVVSSRVRGLLQIETSTKTDRPRSQGLTGRLAYAPTRKDVIKFETSRFSESRSELLRDDRGYFDLTSGEMSYSRYINYDLTVSAGFGLVVETEDNPQKLTMSQLALDVYSLKLDYQGGTWTGGLTARQEVSNLEYRSATLGGQFSWIY